MPDRGCSEEKGPEIWGILSFAHSLSSDMKTLPGPGQDAGGIGVSEAIVVPVLKKHEPTSCPGHMARMVRSQGSPVQGDSHMESVIGNHSNELFE